MDLGEIAIKAV